MRSLGAGVIIVLGLAACGGEPTDRVALPGAPTAGDTRPATTASTTTLETITTDRGADVDATTTVRPSSSTTTAAPSTTSAAVAATTTVPTLAPTTVAEPTTAPAPAPTTTALVYSPEPAEGLLRIGVEGPRSLLVQQQLIALAILPSTAADSKYGPGTAAGVRRFQESKGLVVDGVAGPNTIAALAAAVAALTPSTTAG